MEDKIHQQEPQELSGSLIPAAINEQMIWSYGDWDLKQFNLVDIDIILTAPNRIAAKMHVRSNGTNTVSHPRLMVQVFDQDGQLIVEWTSKDIVISCNGSFIFFDSAVVTAFYYRAVKAKLTMLQYTYRQC